MENSLRNHALVQQQNQQQQQIWNREEYYRNNGIIKSSSATAAPATSSHHGSSHHGSNSAINTSSQRSRNSGSSASGKGSRGSNSRSGKSSRSGEGSDEAVHGVTEQVPKHRYLNEHQLHQQQHQQQQEQQYHYYQQQQQQQYLQQQRYPQHNQYYSSNGGMIAFPQQQDQYVHVFHDSSSSSQHSSSHHQQYIDQHQHQYQYGGGSATDGTASTRSHYSTILGAIAGSATSNHFTEEAYRRVGMRLSLSAHGGDSKTTRSSSHRARIPPRLGFRSPSSCFKPFEERDKEEISSTGNNSSGKSSKGNITKKMTLNVNEVFRLWYTEHSKIQRHQSHRRKKSTNSGLPPSSRTSKTEQSSGREDITSHRLAFAHMTLGDGSHINSHGHSHSHKQTGSLSAVIESGSQNSSTATRSTTTNSRNPHGSGVGQSGMLKGDGNGSVRSEDKSRASSSIATRSSMGTRNSFLSFGTIPPRGKCLTQPSEGVSNDGLCDNVEGNLIVYENENISIPKKQVCVLTRGKIPRGAPSSDFRVQSLLGQGTFAQVFRCLHVQTGQLVAVKIVKNKPAYTRQAAVEIDVIRALTTAGNEKTDSIKNKKRNSGSNNKDRGKTNIDSEGPSHNDNFDYMIDMVCYFLYKDHLCLVFELLGLNLYEVLKKRQFRGLPLVVTRTLVRQAVLGVRRLSQRSIVHCDLKPENILLVDEDDSESVMSAGESKRSRASPIHGSKSSHSSGEKNQKSPLNSADLNPNNRTKSCNEDQALSNDKRKHVSDTDSSKVTLNHQDEKTQTGRTHTSDNSKSTTETDNTRTKKEQHQQQKQQRRQQSSKATEPTTKNLGKSSQGEKDIAIPTSESPMKSTIATYETNEKQPNPICNNQIKLIDFGSACFEGQMSHTYIQSRFYRSPEVLLGLAYDSAIDMWSLGCVAAELFLGLPILPGVHEHDQLGRIIEMIGDTPDWMLDQGTKSSKYFVKYVPTATSDPSTQIQPSSIASEGRPCSTEAPTSGRSGSEAPRPRPQWRIKTQHQYIASLSQSDITKKGGLTKLQKLRNRYFKRKLLSDIILHKGQSGKKEELRLLKSFIHFLYGILDPDPWKRWTAFQVASHPFFTGATLQENIDPSKIKDDNHANRLFNLYWEAPSDPTIYRRKLLNVQKTREKQQAARRGFNRGHGHSHSRSASPSRQDGLPAARNAFSKSNNQGDGTHSVTSDTDEVTNQAATRLIRQGSLTQFGTNQDFRLLSYNSGSHPCSESFNSVGVPGSFNEVDFALALYRPGVVPMGDSVTTSTTSTTSMSSGNNSRSTYNQSNNQTSQAGSFGSHHVLHYSNQQRLLTTGSLPRTSRSFEQVDLAPADAAAIPTIIDSRHQDVLYSSSQGSGMNIDAPIELKAEIEVNFDPSTDTKGDKIPERRASTTSIKSKPPPETIQATAEDDSAPATNPKSNSETNFVNPNQALGTYDSPQVYQQQLAAMQQHFQQQQILLQQQQAAIALQQEQLRAYYSNISNAAGLNLQQLGIVGAPVTPTLATNAPQLGVPGPQATPTPNIQNAAGINTQQFGVPGAQVAASNTMNSQQFHIPGNANAAISSQQFSLSGNTQAPAQSPGLTSQQFGLAGTAAPIQDGGYYIVPTTDGNHMIVPSNQGIPMSMPGKGQVIPPIPGIMPGQLPGLPAMPSQIQGIGSIGLPSVGVLPGDQGIPMSMPGQAQGIPPIPGMLPGQLSGLPTMPSQVQGIGTAGLTSVGVPPGAAVVGMPGIQGMQTSGMISTAGGIPVGLAAIPTTNNNTSPTLSGHYPNTNKQHHLQRQS